MTTNISFPTEVLAHTFSFLDWTSLGRVAAVCRLWKEIQESELGQKFLCLSILRDDKPPQTTWQQRVHVLRNWAQGNFRLSEEPKNYVHDSLAESEVIFSDHLLLQVVLLDRFLNGKIYFRDCTIGYGTSVDINSRINAHTVFNKTVFILNGQSEILCFDILTRRLTKTINPDPHKLRASKSYGKIVCSEREIFVSEKRIGTIWNRETENLSETFPIPDQSVLFACTSTYVLFAKYGYESVRAIPRKELNMPLADQRSVTLKISGPIKTSFACANDYIAIFHTDGTLEVWKDAGESLKKQFNVAPFFDPNLKFSQNHVSIYKNWMLVSKKTQLHIYNMETGKHLFQYSFSNSDQMYEKEFMTDGSQLLLIEKKIENQHYTLYNFS